MQKTDWRKHLAEAYRTENVQKKMREIFDEEGKATLTTEELEFMIVNLCAQLMENMENRLHGDI